MDSLRVLAERLGLEPADLAGLAVALLGALLAAVVALRPPLSAPDPPVITDVAGAPTAQDQATPGSDGAPAGSSTAPTEAPSATEQQGTVVVHVAGEVARPGVHTLPAGARVDAAVAAAGGPTGAARTDLLNLARPLVDGEQVVVPGDDGQPPGGVGTTTGGTGDAAATVDGAELPDGRVDLNRADADDLEELPSIGEVTAERILAWREEHGPFTDPAQLREVRGIGEVTWLGLRDLVGVG